MEFEVLSEAVEWEARRVAAAFGVDEWTVRRSLTCSDKWWRGQRRDVHQQMVYGTVDCISIEWSISGYATPDIVVLIYWIYVGDEDVWEESCRFGLDTDTMQWSLTTDRYNKFIAHPLYAQMMARGLYQLGFEDDPDINQLIEQPDYSEMELRLTMPPDLPPLSMHEKLELRLSMPREFWLQQWLDEEAP